MNNGMPGMNGGMPGMNGMQGKSGALPRIIPTDAKVIGVVNGISVYRNDKNEYGYEPANSFAN